MAVYFLMTHIIPGVSHDHSIFNVSYIHHSLLLFSSCRYLNYCYWCFLTIFVKAVTFSCLQIYWLSLLLHFHFTTLIYLLLIAYICKQTSWLLTLLPEAFVICDVRNSICVSSLSHCNDFVGNSLIKRPQLSGLVQMM